MKIKRTDILKFAKPVVQDEDGYRIAKEGEENEPTYIGKRRVMLEEIDQTIENGTIEITLASIDNIGGNKPVCGFFTIDDIRKLMQERALVFHNNPFR